MSPGTPVTLMKDITTSGDISLILPFTPATFTHPEPLLPTIYQAVLAIPSRSCYIHFASPGSTQLYDTLRQSPREGWPALQVFLSKVYATLAAAQWECGKIGLEVEIGFASTSSGEQERLGRNGNILILEGYEHLGPSPAESYIIYTIPAPSLPSSSALSAPPISAGPAVVALGGTFDHLHAAHKLLLHLAHFLAERKVIVGVMSDSLLSSKSNRDLVQPLSQRIAAVKGFMTRLNATRAEGKRVELDVLEIHDAYGPTRDDPDIQALVISDETRSGGEAVNKLRRENGLAELEVWCIDVISGSTAGERRSPGNDAGEEGGGILKGLDEKTLKEVKMGSTGIRRWLAEKAERDRAGT